MGEETYYYEDYDDFCEQHNEDAEIFKRIKRDTVWETYKIKIEPYLRIIGDFRGRDTVATETQIRLALGVGLENWRVCKKLFPDLEEYLGLKETFLGLKAELDVQKGLINTEYKNPKLHDIQLEMYNQKYRDRKKQEYEEEFPTIKVVYEDARMSEEELDEEFDASKGEAKE